MKFPRPEREVGAPERIVALRPLLAQQNDDKLAEAVRRAGNLERGQLLARFRLAFANRTRLSAFVFAEALIEQGTPPFFWHDALPENLTLDQEFDLFLYDLRWLRRVYGDHVNEVRHKRSRQLLSPIEQWHHREVEFAFYNGKRRPWQHVNTLSLTVRQQWDCAWLHTVTINRRIKSTQWKSTDVMKMITDALSKIPRTPTFTDRDAQDAATRRHALWLCTRTTDGGPTEIAARYKQMTGTEITRQAVAKQLDKLRENLKRKST